MKLPASAIADAAITRRPGPERAGSGNKPDTIFSQVIDAVRSAEGGGHREILEIQKTLDSSNSISARELLRYQVKLGRFNLKVELLSKLSEGVVATARRLQNGNA